MRSPFAVCCSRSSKVLGVNKTASLIVSLSPLRVTHLCPTTRNLINLPQTDIPTLSMADPFGILGLIGVIGQLTQAAVKLGLDWKDAPADAKSFLAEIQALKTVLSETYANILVNDDFKNAFDGRHSTLMAQLGDPAKPTTISDMVSACNQEMGDLLGDLKKRA